MSEMPKTAQVLLASASPRRRRLLECLGLPYETTSVDIEEDLSRPLPPQELAATLAGEKALAAREAHGGGQLVLAFDTIVVHAGRVLGKPADLDEAYGMLRELSGGEHEVVTGVAVLAPGWDEPRTFPVTSKVMMRDLAEEDIDAWAARGELLGCAGAYNIESHLATVERGECFQNVAGLPLCHLYTMLASGEVPGVPAGLRPPVEACAPLRPTPCALGPEVLARSRFGPNAAAYVTSWTHASGDDLDALVRMADAHEGDRALDVATGGGHTALALSRLVSEVVAVDLTPEMLAAAEEHLAGKGARNVTFTVAPADALPFPDASFDVVTCRIASHHFPDVPAFLGEAARVLQPGGRLVVQDQYTPEDEEAAGAVDAFERLRDPSHVHSLSESEWRAAFASAWLTVERSEHFIKRHDYAEWCRTQGCSEETLRDLAHVTATLPAEARDWLLPEYDGEGLVAFSNRHLVMLAVKG